MVWRMYKFIIFIFSLLIIVLSSNCSSIGGIRGQVLFQSNDVLSITDFSSNLLVVNSDSSEVKSEVKKEDNDSDDEDDEFDKEDEFDERKKEIHMADPLEGMNRGIFTFNDFMFTWFFNPMAKAFHFIIPTPVRLGIKNVFLNITTIGRVVNNILQGKFLNSLKEIGRFVINSTIGVAGIFDPATHIFDITVPIEDFGQTLAIWGFGDGVYLQLPFLGPSSVRDGIGKLVDIILSPVTYIPMYLTPNMYKQTALTATFFTVDNVNFLSFNLGQYEDFTKSALDPYMLFKDLYTQYRIKQINE